MSRFHFQFICEILALRSSGGTEVHSSSSAWRCECHQCSTRGNVGHHCLISPLLTEWRLQPMNWLLSLPALVFILILLTEISLWLCVCKSSACMFTFYVSVFCSLWYSSFYMLRKWKLFLCHDNIWTSSSHFIYATLLQSWTGGWWIQTTPWMLWCVWIRSTRAFSTACCLSPARCTLRSSPCPWTSRAPLTRPPGTRREPPSSK